MAILRTTIAFASLKSREEDRAGETPGKLLMEVEFKRGPGGG